MRKNVAHSEETDTGGFKTTQPIAWVTGASSGIGRELALQLTRDGWNVVVSARGSEALEALVREMPGEIRAMVLDVTDRQAVSAAVAMIEDTLGAIDLAVFSAGTYSRDSALGFDASVVAGMVNLNIMGNVHCLEAIMPQMIARKSGQIGVMSSVAGYSGLPGGGAYGATKAALINLCEGLHPELAVHNVRLAIINPGFVDTPLSQKNDFPMPFMISAREAAAYIVAGLKKNRFEIIFPWKMALGIKFLRILPYRLFFMITRRMLRSD